MSDPAHHIKFQLEAGQIQYLNNFSLTHPGKNHEDTQNGNEKRHLVRIFLRNASRRSFMG